MRKLNLFSFLALLIFFISCGENENRDVTEAEVEDMLTVQETPDSEEILEDWNQAWNSNDPARVQAMVADDAVLVLNGNEFPQDSLGAWIQAATAAMRDLELQSLKEGSTGNLAYDTGIFSHTYANDTTQYAGSYTFIWEQSNEEENDWKVKVMNIADAQALGVETNMN